MIPHLQRGKESIPLTPVLPVDPGRSDDYGTERKIENIPGFGP